MPEPRWPWTPTGIVELVGLAVIVVFCVLKVDAFGLLYWVLGGETWRVLRGAR